MPALPDDGPVDVQILMLDRYLDGLLAARGDHSARGHSRGHDPEPIDPSLRDAAHVLRRSLVRVHPSFQFEERLSARLSAMAAQVGPHARLGAVVAFPQLRRQVEEAAGESSHAGAVAAAPVAVPAGRRAAAVRPLLIGGAITSAALSLAGVAWVARRAVRAPALAELEGLL